MVEEEMITVLQGSETTVKTLLNLKTLGDSNNNLFSLIEILVISIKDIIIKAISMQELIHISDQLLDFKKNKDNIKKIIIMKKDKVSRVVDKHKRLTVYHG